MEELNHLKKHCMFCSDCQDLIQIQYGQYLCQKHYEEFVSNNEFPVEFLQAYKKKQIENIRSIFFKKPKALTNGIVIDKPYHIFLPQITLHFDTPIDEFDFSKLQLITKKYGFLVNAKKGSTYVTLVLPSTSNGVPRSRQELQSLLSGLNDQLKSSGNLINISLSSNPNSEEINRFINHPLLNTANIHFPNSENGNSDVIMLVQNIASEDNFILRPRIIIDLQEQYQLAEPQIKASIQSCEYELKILQKIGIDNTSILDRYSRLLQVFPEVNREEKFLFHGCRLSNDDIVDPNRPELSFTNKHLINGFYLTDNPFYAAFHHGPLEITESAWILYAKVLYNYEFQNNLFPLPQKSPLEILLNKGAIKCEIGSYESNFLPCRTDRPFATEYIIDDEAQILPLFVLRVMRSSYCIIWRSDDIDTQENTNYLQQLSNLPANVYPCRTDEEVRNIVYTKRKNRIKFITNQASELIEQVRETIGSNFLCLVYSNDANEQNRIRDRVNVIFTSSNLEFRNFIEMNMDENHYRDFINHMQNENHTQYNIDDDEVFRFPHYVSQIPYDPNRVFQV